MCWKAALAWSGMQRCWCGWAGCNAFHMLGVWVCARRVSGSSAGRYPRWDCACRVLLMLLADGQAGKQARQPADCCPGSSNGAFEARAGLRHLEVLLLRCCRR
ncbi:hypothetical protein COO60DRAFT_1476266 [Scenedesmus sp. NREL 46B-D3]|nr:hypothetical protein COO60DRAFT_1476266 [Scenedesmus sp. NREL 46B-D3]